MTSRVKLEVFAGCLLALVLGVVLYQWHRAELLNAVAQAKTEALQTVVKQNQQTIDAAADAIAKRDAAFAQQQQQFVAQLAAVRTPQQAQPLILDMASKALPVPVQSATDAKTGAVTYTMPAEDIVPLYKSLAQCQQDGKELAVCHSDQVDLRSQAAALTTQRDSYKQEADTWKQAAKGGTVWQRTWKVVKYVSIGALIGGGIVAATKH